MITYYRSLFSLRLIRQPILSEEIPFLLTKYWERHPVRGCQFFLQLWRCFVNEFIVLFTFASLDTGWNGPCSMCVEQPDLQAGGRLNACMLTKLDACVILQVCKICVGGKTPGKLHSQSHEDTLKAESRAVSPGWTLCSSSVQAKQANSSHQILLPLFLPEPLPMNPRTRCSRQ